MAVFTQHDDTAGLQSFDERHLYLCLTGLSMSQSFAVGVKGRDYEISFLEEEFSLFE